jgi:uncharacterized cupredoxin-like copper-binding protein
MSFARRALVVVLAIEAIGFLRQILFVFGLERFLGAIGRAEPVGVIVSVLLISIIVLIVPVARGNRWATLATLPVLLLLLVAVLPVFMPIFGTPNEGNFAVWITLTVLVFATALVGIPFSVVAILESFGRLEPGHEEAGHGFSAANMFAVASAGAITGMAALAVAVAASPSTGDAAFDQSPDASASITMSELRFEPDDLQIATGQSTAVFVTNADGFDHSFDIDVLDLHVMVPAHQTKVVMLDPDVDAVFELYCAIPGHRETGMVGRVLAQ